MFVCLFWKNLLSLNLECFFWVICFCQILQWYLCHDHFLMLISHFRNSQWLKIKSNLCKGPSIITNSRETHPTMPHREHGPKPTSSVSSPFINKIFLLDFLRKRIKIYVGVGGGFQILLLWCEPKGPLSRSLWRFIIKPLVTKMGKFP